MATTIVIETYSTYVCCPGCRAYMDPRSVCPRCGRPF